MSNDIGGIQPWLASREPIVVVLDSIGNDGARNAAALGSSEDFTKLPSKVERIEV
jgi:hypothetical protein